jgi:hypothetical protein
MYTNQDRCWEQNASTLLLLLEAQTKRAPLAALSDMSVQARHDWQPVSVRPALLLFTKTRIRGQKDHCQGMPGSQPGQCQGYLTHIKKANFMAGLVKLLSNVRRCL